MRKVIISVLAVIIIAGAAYAAKVIVDSKTAPKSKVKKEVKIVTTDTIQNATLSVVIPSNGILQAKRRVELYSEVSGVFKTTGKLFRTGQPYRAGEVIIRMDNQEFYSQVQSSRSNLNNLITSIMPDLRLDYPDSFNQWQDYLERWDRNAATPQLPEAINDKEKYFITGRNIYSSYYNLKNLENRLTKFRIRAPFDGIVTEAMVSEGTLVRNGQQLGEFIQTGVYEIEVAISAEFVDLLKLGESVELINVTGTKTYQGEVTRINGKVDQATQTISTIIEVTSPDLKEGMYLTANLQSQKIDNAVELDRGLLQDGDQIFVIQDSTLQLKSVQPVHFSNTTVVLKGIEDGTVIISKSVPGAYEGLLVKTEEQQQAENAKKDAQKSTENDSESKNS
jgi:multidrug efflux pump subunit AcrA (membrane-fusion protein)